MILRTIFLLLPISIVCAEDNHLWLDVNIASRHSTDTYFLDGEIREFQEYNRGLGLSYEVTSFFDFKTGFFRNSYNKNSFYGLASLKFDLLKDSKLTLAPGIAGGLVSGYENTPEMTEPVAPWGMLTLSTGTDRWRVNLGYLPARLFYENATEVVMIQASIRIF